MDKEQESLLTWNKVAKNYQDKFMNLDLYNDSYDIFLDLIRKPNATILEIGCGPGNISKYLLSKKADLKIKGIDISENMIELARKNIPNAEFEIMDCREIDSMNNKYDAIICGFCIPYVSEADSLKLIVNCNNLLNDSGILYLSFVAGDYKNSGFITGSSGDRTYFYYHSLDTLKKVLKANSLKANKVLLKNYINADGIVEVHTILISKKIEF